MLIYNETKQNKTKIEYAKIYFEAFKKKNYFKYNLQA